MSIDTQIKPSVSARTLFGKMVARADDKLHLSLADSIKLSIDLRHAGRNPKACNEVTELIEEEWIDPHPEGGWILH